MSEYFKDATAKAPLLERLRRFAMSVAVRSDGIGRDSGVVCEAFEEIERLQREVAELREALKEAIANIPATRVCNLNAKDGTIDYWFDLLHDTEPHAQGTSERQQDDN